MYIFNFLICGFSIHTIVVIISFVVRDSMFEMVSDASGRVLQFDLETKETKVKIYNLFTMTKTVDHDLNLSSFQIA